MNVLSPAKVTSKFCVLLFKMATKLFVVLSALLALGEAGKYS